jgi:hypothetical protein
MKEVEKKDVPEVSGGKPIPESWLPIMPYPLPDSRRRPAARWIPWIRSATARTTFNPEGAKKMTS